MGRETKILLGLLGLLAGVFVGALSMKLLVPRPPAGAGPDIHADVADAESHELVEPPPLTMRASAFAAAPPLVPQDAKPAEPVAAADRYAAGNSRFEPAAPASAAPESGAEPPAELPRRDPFVAQTAFQQPADEPQPAPRFEPVQPLPAASGMQQPMPLGTGMPDVDVPAASDPPGLGSFPPAATPLASGHVAQPGDSWWSLAERAYGDGRLYRALFAWNRSLDPRVSLAPGTALEIPPLDKLAAAWPRLLPARER
jgi:5'-nucleotidase/UDP-sugar diphosphatase